MILAPIVFFTYNRANHAQQAINSLLTNQEANESDLIIYSDGPRGISDMDAVEKNRAYIHSIRGFKSITIIEREKNWGLANSLIDGITTVVNKYGRVIVVEDDLIVSPFFLKYMNDALIKYEYDNRISAISAFVHPINGKLPKTYFLRYFACWGWATWKRGWDIFNPDANDLLQQFHSYNQYRIFNIDFSVKFYEMLKLQADGKIDSWAIRFNASLFLAGKLILFPHKSMTAQTGFDGSGVHCGKDNEYSYDNLNTMPVNLYDDIPVAMSKKAYRIFWCYYWRKLGKIGKLKALISLLGINYKK